MTWNGNDQADLDEREDPDPGDTDRNEDPELIACPFCRAMIREDAEQCSECGQFISREDAPYRPKWWIVLGVLLIVAATLILSFVGWRWD